MKILISNNNGVCYLTMIVTQIPILSFQKFWVEKSEIPRPQFYAPQGPTGRKLAENTNHDEGTWLYVCSSRKPFRPSQSKAGYFTGRFVFSFLFDPTSCRKVVRSEKSSSWRFIFSRAGGGSRMICALPSVIIFKVVVDRLLVIREMWCACDCLEVTSLYRGWRSVDPVLTTGDKPGTNKLYYFDC